MKKRRIKGFIFLLVLAALAVLPVSELKAAGESEETVLAGEGGEPPKGYEESQEQERSVDAASDISWSLENGVLRITGAGEMPSYGTQNLPEWYGERRSITSIVIEDGITSIGSLAFYDCFNVKNVDIAPSVSVLGDAAFYGCSSLEKVEVPAAVKILPSGLFVNCTNLSEITADGVTTIADYAFQNTGFSTFTVGRQVTSFSTVAMFDTPVESYQVEAGNPVYTAEDGIVFTDQGQTLYAYPAGDTRTAYTVPAGVTKIGKEAFLQSRFLQSVVLGNEVSELGQSAFQECRGFRSLVIPDTVTKVGNWTFYQCENLESVTFGNSLDSTSDGMFEECTSLTAIDFGTKLKDLGARTFAYCSALEEIVLPENIQTVGQGCFGKCSALTSVTSFGVTAIGFQAFLNDGSLSELNFHEGLQSIDRCAFLGCWDLTEVELPQSVTFVHSFAFEDDVNITCLNPEMDPFGENGYRRLDRVTVSSQRSYGPAYEVLRLVNEERTKNGLGSLVMNESLMESAMVRAAETSVLFAHTRPDSSICFDLNDLMRGENIASGQTSAAGAVDSWMNSSGHRANILSTRYTTIGVGCVVVDGIYYWVQCFGDGDDTADCAQPADQTVKEEIAVAMERFDEATQSRGIIFGSLESYEYQFGVGAVNGNMVDSDSSTECYAYIVNPSADSWTRLDGSSVIWESSDPSMASVENGKVQTTSKSGTVTISAHTKEGYFNGSMELKVGDQGPHGIGLPFADVTGSDWFAGYVKYAYENGIMTGLTPTTFGPGEPLARAQFAIILHRLNGTPAVDYTARFHDVAAGIWYTDAILWAADTGVVTGYSNGNFGPGDNINREQMAVMMYRYAAYKGYDTSVKADFSQYQDAGRVSDFAREAMQWAVGEQIITGKYDETQLDPQGEASRAECATIMMRFMERYGG